VDGQRRARRRKAAWLGRRRSDHRLAGSLGPIRVALRTVDFFTPAFFRAVGKNLSAAFVALSSVRARWCPEFATLSLGEQRACGHSSPVVVGVQFAVASRMRFLLWSLLVAVSLGIACHSSTSPTTTTTTTATTATTTYNLSVTGTSILTGLRQRTQLTHVHQ